MSKQVICHAHCPKGGGGLAAVLAVLAVVAAAAIARPVVHAAEDVLKIAVIAVASVAGLAAIGGITYAALRARSSHATNRLAVSQHAPAIERSAQALSAPPRLAIEAPRPQLADLEALAAEHGYDIIRQAPED